MKKKMVLAAALVAFAAVSAFAEVGMYIKGAAGYGYRWGMDWTTTVGGTDYSWKETYGDAGIDFNLYSHLVEIVPTFGIEPWRGSSNPFLRGLSFEISADVGIGKASLTMSQGNYSETSDLEMSFVITPKVMAVYTYRAGMIAPYIGAGVSVPIAIIPRMTEDNVEGYVENAAFKVGINGNVMAGVGFMVTPSVMPVIEADFGFGSSMRIDGRIGIVYRLGLRS